MYINSLHHCGASIASALSNAHRHRPHAELEAEGAFERVVEYGARLALRCGLPLGRCFTSAATYCIAPSPSITSGPSPYWVLQACQRSTNAAC